MRYDSGQFREFDGLDNRKTLIDLFKRLGEHLPPPLANQKRADFLTGLIPASVSCFAKLPLVVQPCSPVDAYFLFVAITGVLGVEINEAAKRLEREVRRQ